MNAALAERGVAVLTLPGDVGGLDAAQAHADAAVRRPTGRAAGARRRESCAPRRPRSTPPARSPCSSARAPGTPATRCSRLADHLSAPMVLTLKAKEGFEDDNDFEIGQSGLIGNHATAVAFEGCDALVMLGTDFPYKDFLPAGQDRGPARRARRPRRTPYAGRPTPWSATPGSGSRQLLPLLAAKPDRGAPRQGPLVVRAVARAPAAARRPRLRPQAEGPAAPQGRQPRRPGPSRAARRGGRPARRRGRDLHHRHRDGHGLALPVRPDERHPPAARLLQPRLDGQRDAAGPRRRRARPGPAGRRVLRRRRALDADGRPDHRGLPRPAGQAGRLRQRPARDGEAGDGAGRAAGVRHRAAQPRLRRGGAGRSGCTASGSSDPHDVEDGGPRGARPPRSGAARRASPTPTRSRSRPSRPSSRAGASRSPRPGSSSHS